MVAVYYGSVLWQCIMAVYYGSVLWQCIMAVYYGSVQLILLYVGTQLHRDSLAYRGEVRIAEGFVVKYQHLSYDNLQLSTGCASSEDVGDTGTPPASASTQTYSV
eukprot:GHVQ01017967.1.p1 GENE.GHVQ01017967.1~~GHVQ01017967.1.p1  ORF type:complete len:105 (+),score=7.08 GHVQ01017967.1:72-386(+)